MTSKFIYKAIRIKGAFELIIIIYDQEWEMRERKSERIVALQGHVCNCVTFCKIFNSFKCFNINVYIYMYYLYIIEVYLFEDAKSYV